MKGSRWSPVSERVSAQPQRDCSPSAARGSPHRRDGRTITWQRMSGATIPLIAQMPDNDAMRRCHGQLRIAYGAPFPAALVDAWRNRFGVEIAAPQATG